MKRVQIQFTPEQISQLKEQAAEYKVSVSELVRRGVDQLLGERHRPSREELVRRSIAAMGTIDLGADDVAANHDKYLAEGSHK